MTDSQLLFNKHCSEHDFPEREDIVDPSTLSESSLVSYTAHWEHYQSTMNGVNVILRTSRDGRVFDEEEREHFIVSLVKCLCDWKRASGHNNIAPFYGLTTIPSMSSLPIIVSPPKNQRLNYDYLTLIPNEQYSHRLLLVLIKVAGAIEHMHSLNPPVVHGMIRGNNILIDQDEEPLLADFGFSLLPYSRQLEQLHDDEIRWQASEFLHEIPVPVPAHDVYSFGITILEVLSRQQPWSEVSIYDKDVAVKRKTHPGYRVPRPWRKEVTDEAWSLIQSCTDEEPDNRPKMKDVKQKLETLFKASAQTIRSSGQDSPSRTNIDRKGAETLFNKYCRAFEISEREGILHPFWLSKFFPIGRTPHWEHYQSTMNGVNVILRKSPDDFNMNEEERELFTVTLVKCLTEWKRASNHKSIAPFYGLTTSPWSLLPILVFPGPKKQTLAYNHEYLDLIPEDQYSLRLLRILLKVADALVHMHSLIPPVVHGLIRGANILIDQDEEPFLADFGFSLLPHSSRYEEPHYDNIRWKASELLHRKSIPVPAHDVYSFGMTMLELLSGKPPWADIKADVKIYSARNQGHRVCRPQINKAVTDEAWRLIQSCTDEEPDNRPKMKDVKEKLEFLLAQELGTPRQEAPRTSAPTIPSSAVGQDSSSFTEIKPDNPPQMKNVKYKFESLPRASAQTMICLLRSLWQKILSRRPTPI